MEWLTKLSRNLGLMVHNIKHPQDADNSTNQTTTRQQVKKTVEEQQIDPVTTLRRTTIEEIEVRKPKAEQPD